MTSIAFIIMFGVLVFFHELGHLYFAKRAGILCRDFAIGFGPKLFSFKRNETLYTIRLFPIGGYVKMAGEDGEIISIKPGQRVGLLLNAKNEVEKIYTKGFASIPNVKVIEVESADLEKKLEISGRDEMGEISVYQVWDCCEVMLGKESYQIAPTHRQFHAKKLSQRALTIFAGPAMNFLLAFVLFTFLALFQGIPSEKPIMGQLTPDGAALQAGLAEGDKILSINGTSVQSWENVVGIVRENPEQVLTFEVERADETMTFQVTPSRVEEEGKSVGKIGAYQPREKSPVQAFKYGVVETVDWTKRILDSVGKLITGQFSIQDLSGPVGIYNYTDEVVQSGFYTFINWMAFLSINLGIMNLLPLPALDGGRLLFFAIEGIRGKPIDPQKEGMVHFIGFALLMLLMIAVTWNDIKNLFFQ